jgi:peptidoglycan/LPS O-acetylase OafA/YrhL
MKGMWKWLCEAYVAVTLLYLFFHSWAWSWTFAFRTAFWIFLGGSGMLTLFGYLCAKASMPRPATDYLGKDGEVRMPLGVRVLTWSAYAVILVGTALILVAVFFEVPR